MWCAHVISCISRDSVVRPRGGVSRGSKRGGGVCCMHFASSLLWESNSALQPDCGLGQGPVASAAWHQLCVWVAWVGSGRSPARAWSLRHRHGGRPWPPSTDGSLGWGPGVGSSRPCMGARTGAGPSAHAQRCDAAHEGAGARAPRPRWQPAPRRAAPWQAPASGRCAMPPAQGAGAAGAGRQARRRPRRRAGACTATCVEGMRSEGAAGRRAQGRGGGGGSVSRSLVHAVALGRLPRWDVWGVPHAVLGAQARPGPACTWWVGAPDGSCAAAVRRVRALHLCVSAAPPGVAHARRCAAS